MVSNRQKSWIFLAFTPFALLVGIVFSEWLYTTLGYEVGTTNAPIRIKLLMLVVSFLVILTLPALAVIYGRRAISQGEPKAKSPVIIAAVFLGAFILSSLPGLFAK